MAGKKGGSPIASLKKFSLDLPGAYEDHPWGESVAKVAKKVFVFLGRDGEAEYGIGVKLPQSKSEALSLDYVEPMGYGLGKSGWVSVFLSRAKNQPDEEMLKDWILESYRAVAPKKMLAELEARRLGLAEESPAPKKKPAAKKSKKKKR